MRLYPRINPFRRAETDPPHATVPFFLWALKGAWIGIIWAAFWSAVAGTLEAISAMLLGMVIDAVNGTARTEIVAQHGLLIAGFVVFYIVIRPAVFGMNTSAATMLVEPNIFPLILSRLHRFDVQIVQDLDVVG